MSDGTSRGSHGRRKATECAARTCFTQRQQIQQSSSGGARLIPRAAGRQTVGIGRACGRPFPNFREKAGRRCAAPSAPAPTAAANFRTPLGTCRARSQKEAADARQGNGDAVSGVLLAILVLALVIGKIRGGTAAEVERSKAAQVEIFNRNVDLARAEIQKATSVWTLAKIEELFQEHQGCTPKRIKAKVTAAVKEKLFAPYIGNTKIYNVWYVRDYKDRKSKGETKPDQYQLFEDMEHLSINKLTNPDYTKDEPDLNICYGLTAGKSIPVVMARKLLHPLRDDAINAGAKFSSSCLRNPMTS